LPFEGAKIARCSLCGQPEHTARSRRFHSAADLAEHRARRDGAQSDGDD
jgi:hypothetical protein